MYDIVTVVFVYVACYNNNGWLSSWTVCCTILLVFVHRRQAGVCIHTTIHWYSTCTRVIQILERRVRNYSLQTLLLPTFVFYTLLTTLLSSLLQQVLKLIKIGHTTCQDAKFFRPNFNINALVTSLLLKCECNT